MSEFFPEIKEISYQGPESQHWLAYRYYDAKRKVLGKTMAEHLRLAVCYWHNFCWHGHDNFGEATFSREWKIADTPLAQAELRASAAFEFIQKL